MTEFESSAEMFFLPKKATPLWMLMWNAYNDKVLLLLTAAAVISLALGLYETFGTEHEAGAPTPVDWVEGLAICVAIIIVVGVGSLNDWQKERAFVRLNTKKEDREVKVIRSGKSYMINVHDVLVGDVLFLEPGDLVPVDGIFIHGHELKCDESSATGESDALKKTGGAEVLKLLADGHSNIKDLDPFIISGAKVLEGVGTFVCTSVGVNSSFGKIMMSVRTEMESTPLQKKLEGLATAIAKLGSTAAALLFFVLLFRFLGSLSGDSRTGAEKASSFMDILVVAITVIVVAVPEGLPLTVTLALAFATTRLLKGNNLVRVLRACETMGNATTICSNKTGTQTTNKMTVVAGTFGDASFGKSNDENVKTATEFARGLPKPTRDLLIQSVAINSTAFEGEEHDKSTFIGSKTETALLQFARDNLGMGPISEERANSDIVQLMSFDFSKKCMGAAVRLPSGGYRILVKGASEILLDHCIQYADIETQQTSELTKPIRTSLENTITAYAKQSLRTIGLVYKDISQWPPEGARSKTDPSSADFGSVLTGLVFVGVVGIQDPVRPGVPEAVARAKSSGVVVRMVTGDNAVTAQAIATECGIYTDGLIMEGPVFRTLSDNEMGLKLPKLQVLARSSPEDKRILVARLQSYGETVAVTGDGTNDAPALKTADVGFSMGIAGTEVVKEASSIVLMDDNFTSVLTALKWGRAVNDAVQKFLQFQITVNITAVLLTFISAVTSSKMESVLTAVQLPWVNLIMDTFAALALATDPPTEKILDRPPQRKGASLITISMWKMITGQAIFQLTVTLILYFVGSKILGYDQFRDLELSTIVFNTFVWMQIFNEFNNRRLDNKFNIVEGVHRNKFFIAIYCIMVRSQIAIIFVGGKAFSITAIDDIWFEAIATFLGRPFVILYKTFSRNLSSVISIFQRTRNRAEESDGSISPPEIVVTSSSNDKGPGMRYVEDVEKGRGRNWGDILVDKMQDPGAKNMGLLEQEFASLTSARSNLDVRSYDS
ncbi:calcium-translocating P-type ATPase, PMCA-type [Rhinocladiella mackenziei CBS 650.93]|uniref:Calcium-transporting ATPase n=1 Tax=Rhinocladiella mackenziei CBS 650.93 TaxID=1442369 RepID=A0A0D2I4A5_9EURO|nr:calcium-translocating P-type ATPase, PMCA-type [Rhinocladiella mackenziei CBS 650.93]KIX00604.1 calcium-translocating P-type ATPase, PMCA-type [Rhinocladiella mackenziei CBS 650.93]